MKTACFVVAVPLLLAGCASPSSLPDVLAVKSPVNPLAKPIHYHPAIRGYVHREPTAPEPWVKGNAQIQEGENQ